ncbi:ArdC-like ssDNA-binding domain-containing protein [Rummeliibacillus stabekisii]|uniref:ArdC-like ssDNA-binding domain-containing protein n=1 Tax=Rummeliibacillus stabekisii TaxID=241244 RepID=UPI00203AAD4A|nr:ArdC-like ssDNA-binding domain-containing protein [Rummeliibacillus stabekisii]MCM3318006.1 ArdC-like ssDNA-binding domain-containing protein [Rummeliibacillus stabekisii]
MATKPKKKYEAKTTEQKQADVDELFNVLNEGVLNVQMNPDIFKALLEMSALMPSYSFRNVILIKAQCPHARYVASFKEWKELNRHVKKGERSIRILAPRFKMITDEETGEREKKLIGFVSVPVFDYSQTDGEPLPIEKCKLTLEGESTEAEEILQLVKSLAAKDECKFEFGDTGYSNGYYAPALHLIRVSEKLTTNHKAKTAVHELVHSRVHRDSRQSTSEEERECVAEGTAFIICSYFGLDTSSYSFEYVKSWSDNEEAVLKYGTIIRETAEQLINEFELAITLKEDSELEEAESQVLDIA